MMGSRSIVVTVALAALAALLVAWWLKPDSLGYLNLEDMPRWLRSFDATSQDRSGVHHSTTIMFEDLSYFISTQEATKIDGERWEYVFGGESRDSGYFVVPRMEWAETIGEVEELIRADYSRGIGIPTAALGD